jgi:putative radical SAM enzyme (TIGR03279 family)
MQQADGHRISHVQEGSIAADIGLYPGDRLMLIDGQLPLDIFDYQMRQMSEKLLLTICTSSGELIEFDIEKDEEEDLGLDFDKPLLDDFSVCQNHCVFCFIDQLPPGLRPSLYIKDDDLRLSFLSGNYVTLTNLDETALDRLIACRLSPVNVSVHATDPQLRQKMLRNKQAGAIMPRLAKIAAAGLAINAQIVLCPSLNDGQQLHKTIQDLSGLGACLQSIAVVPVGITRFRQENSLCSLRPLTPDDAVAALHEINSWQERMLLERQTRLVYAADEIYQKAGWPLPKADEYEDFPQLENGVGMASLLIKELEEGLQSQIGQTAAGKPLLIAWPSPAAGRCGTVGESGKGDTGAALLASGTAAAPLLHLFQARISAWSGIHVETAAVTNYFFGETVTVAGLLTGQDLVSQLPGLIRQLSQAAGIVRVILPSCLIKAGEDVLLDNWTIQQLSDQLHAPIYVCPADAQGLLGTLAWLKENGSAAACSDLPKGVT